jgi:hypothetical protein
MIADDSIERNAMCGGTSPADWFDGPAPAHFQFAQSGQRLARATVLRRGPYRLIERQCGDSRSPPPIDMFC